MPLKNLPITAKPHLDSGHSFDVTKSRELHGANETKARRGSEESNDSRVSNPLGAKDVISQNQRQNALALKVKVVDGLNGRPFNAGNSLTARRRTTGQVKAHTEQVHAILPIKKPAIPNRTQMPSHIPQESVFDHTESFEDDSSLQGDENHTMVFRGNQLQSEEIKAPFNQSQILQRSTTRVPPMGVPIDFLQEKAQMEREYQQRERQYASKTGRQPMFNTQAKVGYNETVEEQQTLFDTPSRAKTNQLIRPPPSTQITKNVTFDSPGIRGKHEEREDSPELEIHRSQAVIQSASVPPAHEQVGVKAASLNRLQTDREQEAMRQSFSHPLAEQHHEQHFINPPKISTTDTFRASDYPTSSEDEVPPIQSRPPTPALENQNLTKRRRNQDLDYDVNALNNMKYEDLHRQPFDTDPTNFDEDVAFNSQGDIMSLSQRLNNLNKMSEQEQKIMFRKQGDTEWAQMGSWFIERLQEDLKKLMDIRLERRKISMKFEDEIRRRQRDIEWHSTGVEQELKDLKQGGGELIKGRDAPSRRGTPQKK